MKKELNENIKKVGVFNIVIIIAAIVVRFFNFSGQTINIKIDILLCSSSLLSGLFYALNGYKKNAEVYYRLFFTLFMIGNAITIVSPLLDVINRDMGHGGVLVSALFLVANIIVFLCSIPLALAKNLGRKKALVLAGIIFAIYLAKAIRAIVLLSPINYIAANIGNLFYAYIICVFVNARHKENDLENI